MKMSFVLIRTLARASLVIGVSFFIVACAEKTEPPDVKTSEIARTALVDWLECEECTEDQLEKVLKHGSLLQPLLVSTLHQGAAPASQELYRRELEKRYDELIVYSKTHPHAKPTLSKQAFVQLYLGNLKAQYQSRSAKALAAIGGEKPRQALQQALNKTDREDVKHVIKESLQNMQ